MDRRTQRQIFSSARTDDRLEQSLGDGQSGELRHLHL